MKKRLAIACLGLMVGTTYSYTLTDTDDMLIDSFEEKVAEMDIVKQSTIYNTINSYLQLLQDDTRTRSILQSLVSSMENTLDDHVSTSDEIENLLDKLIGADANGIDLQLTNITTNGKNISMKLCSEGLAINDYILIQMKTNNQSREIKYFWYNDASNNGCQNITIAKKTRTTVSKDMVFEVTANRSNTVDGDESNNTMTKPLTIEFNQSHGAAPDQSSYDLYIQSIQLYPQTDDILMTVCADGRINNTIKTRLYSNNRTIIVEEFLHNKETETVCVEHYIDGFQFLFIPGRTYVFEARIDPYNTFFEENETNNYQRVELFIPQFIAFVDGEKKPDFSIDTIGYNHETDTIDVGICHEGGSYKGELYTKIEINTRGMLLRENVIMRTNQNICFVESIEAEKFKLTNKKRYSVRAQTDFKRQIPEWNENNNRKTETIFVGSDSEETYARTSSTDNDTQESSTNIDFYINDINFLRAERKIEVAVCTKNKDYAGYNHILYEANNKVYTQYVFLDLKKNECDAFKLGYRTLNLELEQNYTINVTIDPEEGVIEADEKNNNYEENISTATK